MTTNATQAFEVRIADRRDACFAAELCSAYETSAKVRGIGIAKRNQAYLEKKMIEGKAVIAVSLTETGDRRLAGFCYIESWGHERFVVNSGLLVLPEFRQEGLAKRIKNLAFDLSRSLYPDAKIFGLTTSSAVMKLNSDLGYRPVTYSELTDDRQFWDGCSSCTNYESILVAKNFKHCLCTGMLFDPEAVEKRAARQPVAGPVTETVAAAVAAALAVQPRSGQEPGAAQESAQPAVVGGRGALGLRKELCAK